MLCCLALGDQRLSAEAIDVVGEREVWVGASPDAPTQPALKQPVQRVVERFRLDKEGVFRQYDAALKLIFPDFERRQLELFGSQVIGSWQIMLPLRRIGVSERRAKEEGIGETEFVDRLSKMYEGRRLAMFGERHERAAAIPETPTIFRLFDIVAAF